MTNQEAFDKMMYHLRSLYKRSTDESGECVYNGSKCAIGALMTDDEQEKFGEFRGAVDELIERMEEAGHSSALADLDEDLLDRMQTLHDSCLSWGPRGFSNETRAYIIARKHNLVYTASAKED